MVNVLKMFKLGKTITTMYVSRVYCDSNHSKDSLYLFIKYLILLLTLQNQVVLIKYGGCDSCNMFCFVEIARDDFHEREGFEVIGGVMSPVHDMYRKPELAVGKHRCAMVKISLQTSDWIRLSGRY